MRIYSYNLDNVKDSNLSVVKFYESVNKKEILLFNFYVSLVNRKIKNLSRGEFLKLKYKLYDTKITANVIEIENYYKVTYNAKFIKDSYVDDELQEKVIKLLNDMINTDSFDQLELEIIKKDYLIYLNKMYENNSLVSEDNLLSNIWNGYLSLDEMKDNVENITIEDINEIANKTKLLPGYASAVNVSKEIIKKHDFHLLDKRLEIKEIEYQATKIKEINRNLDQCYVTMGLTIGDYSYIKRNIANLILGGDVFSFLFKIIREEKHISYSVGSKSYSRKLILIETGVSIDWKDKIEEEIKAVINMILSKGFEKEFKLAKKSLKERFIADKNSISFLNVISQLNYINNENKKIEDFLSEIEKVKYEEIKEVFESINIIGTSLVW